MTFEVYATDIDYSTYFTDPAAFDPVDPTTYYDANEVMVNTDENNILQDMQKGFIGLAMDILGEMDSSAFGNMTNVTASPESDDVPATTEAPESDDVPATTTTAAPARKLRGNVVDRKMLQMKGKRGLQDISFLIGGNLTTAVFDAACPPGLTYAPEGASCLEFKYTITPPNGTVYQQEMLMSFAQTLTTAIANGELITKIQDLNADTLIIGAGSPGGTGESFDSQNEESDDTPAASVSEDTNKEASADTGSDGLGAGAIVGIIIAVLAVPIAFLAYKSYNKRNSAEQTRSFSGVPFGVTSSDDEVAGTATRIATAVALKADASTKLGFTYKMTDGQIVITSVKEGGIFEGTPLKAGNEITSINGQEVKGMDKESFRQILSNLPNGNITIVMNETVPLTILRIVGFKPDADSKLGFTYKFIGNKCVVASVKEDGIFAETELKKGQEIVSINSRRIEQLNKDQFRGLLQSLPQGRVIITVKDIIEFAILKIVTTKPQPDSKLGFMYKVLDDGITVASVNDSGIFANTQLNKGQEIVSVNGKNVQKMDKDNFRVYLSTIPAGEVTFIVVDKPKKWSKLGTTLICTAVKETDDTKLGFTYKVMKEGAVVESVGEYGIFASTDLAQGQEIVSVNGVPVAGMDRMEFREQLSSLKAGEVTIVVVDRSSKWNTKGEILVVIADKETDATKLGFTYKVLKNSILVESVKPDGIFGSTVLAKGQEIMSINGTNVRGFTRDQFRETLTSLPAGTVRIVVSDSFKALVAKGGIVTATAEKVTDDTKLGFTYKVFRDEITIESVKDDGIFGATGLAPGQKVIRVNATPVKGLDRNGFRELLSKLTAGPVTIDAYDTSKEVEAVAAPQATVDEEAKTEEQGDIVEVEIEVPSPEEQAKIDEIIEQVRILVEQATPGKSADEMLAQYAGREEELLAHLRKFADRNQ